jgi:hypothetical protein
VQPRFLSGYGLIESPLGECLERLGGAELAGRGVLGLDAAVSTRDRAASYLSHLTHPATRLVLFAVNDRWTAVLNNLRGGSDFADFQWPFSRICRRRTCRVVDQEGWIRKVNGYRVRMRYTARIFVLADEAGANVRSIACAEDDGGRWTFETCGNPLPGEAGFDYTAARRRDRFTSANLAALLSSLGVEPRVPEAFARSDHFRLLALKEEAARVETEACTPEEADDPGYGYLMRGMRYVPHMKTHATSVVSDLTRAILLNPDLKGRASPHLERARLELGDGEFLRISADAAERLRRRGG